MRTLRSANRQIEVPPVEELQAALEPLTLRQIDKLAALSGVSASLIYKVRQGVTTNPGIATVRMFAPHIKAASKSPR